MSDDTTAVTGGPPPLVAAPGDALPPGARIAEFEIRSVLGAGGFGIVYLAWDHALEREVALKEYMPVSLAGRTSSRRVSVRAGAQAETFQLGLRSFVNEARLLARFDHASLVKVYRFWEDNGTAYMVMPMYHGRTLRQVRQAMPPGSPGEAWCRAVLEPLLGALDCLHREDVYHRDIAPDNVLLTQAGKPVLLDFGAARKVIGDRSHALTAIVKPNFAPIEQYADVASVRQGPWTDIYAMAATTYYLLTGQPPLPAAARALHDELVPLQRLQPADCSLAFLEAVDWALAVRPKDRPQSIAQWVDVLEGRMSVPGLLRGETTQPNVTVVSVTGVPVTDFDPTRPPPRVSSPEPSPADPAMGFEDTQPWQASAPASQPVPAAPAATAARRRGRAPLAAAAAAVAVVAITGWAWRAGPSPAMAGASPAASAVTHAASASGVALASAAPTAMGASSPSVAVAPVAASGPASVLPPTAALAPGETVVADGAPGRPAAMDATPASKGTAPARPAPPPRNAARETKPERTAPRHAGVAGPRERCGDRRFLALVVCMKQQCDSDSRLRSHPECQRMEKAERERRDVLNR